MLIARKKNSRMEILCLLMDSGGGCVRNAEIVAYRCSGFIVFLVV